MKQKNQCLFKENIIFIPYNVPSLKNSKIKSPRGIFSSKAVKKYLSLLGIQQYSTSKKEVKGYVKKPNIIAELKPQFLQLLEGKTFPLEIGFHFVRNSKRQFDFNNATQIIADLFVSHDIIPDDNMDYFIPYCLKKDNLYYSIDKENPGVYIEIK